MPWDDASFFFAEGSKSIDGVYGPNQVLYFNYEQPSKQENAMYQFLETTDGKQATIMFGTFGYAWGETATGNGCLIYPRADKSGYKVSDDCVLKPWDDASFHYPEENSAPNGVYGPSEDLYFFKKQPSSSN
jgi:hypothetical protein